jgi:5-methylcytosine-specific restriction protein A
VTRRQQLAQAAAEASARAQRQPDTRCGLCERDVQHTTRHHLVPREEGGRYGDTVDLCQPCHSSVHRFLTNRALARQYHTVEALRTAEELQGYLSWIRKNKVEKIRNRRASA